MYCCNTFRQGTYLIEYGYNVNGFSVFINYAIDHRFKFLLPSVHTDCNQIYCRNKIHRLVHVLQSYVVFREREIPLCVTVPLLQLRNQSVETKNCSATRQQSITTVDCSYTVSLFSSSGITMDGKSLKAVWNLSRRMSEYELYISRATLIK